ncbi:MAG: DUF177 domain-containing protein [Desulfosarcinaceae bacterium]
MIRLEISKIPPQGMTIQREVAADAWPVLKQLAESGECIFGGPIRFDLRVYPEPDLIVVTGGFEAHATLVCSRCLAAFESPLEQRFMLRYGREITQDLHGDDPEEIELTADQIGVGYYEGEEIALDDALQEQVVLALPFKPLCREACKGICPGCGADLNHESCICLAKTRETPFAVLKDMPLPTKK